MKYEEEQKKVSNMPFGLTMNRYDLPTGGENKALIISAPARRHNEGNNNLSVEVET